MILDVYKVFERALESISARVFFESLAVGFSGGLDSSVLLHLAARYAEKRKIPLYGFHVHHGLSPDADAWLARSKAACGALGIGFSFRKVAVDASGSGTEAAARTARYRALGDMCREKGVPLLLAAHHRDDQAETVLLRLFRGAGLYGLAGMAETARLPELTGPGVTVGRPLLSIPKLALTHYASEHKIAFAEDASNADTRYARNAIRHRILPEAEAAFPGAAARIARTAELVLTAAEIVRERALEDLALCRIGEDAIDAEKALCAGPARAAAILYEWFAGYGLKVPSEAWFLEAERQLFSDETDASVLVETEGFEIRRYRKRITVKRVSEKPMPPEEPFSFVWKGEKETALTAWGGVLSFREGPGGIPRAWLSGREITVFPYRGSERLRLPGRPAKTIKSLCQEAGIPASERLFLPLVYAGKDLVFAGGIGQKAMPPGSHGILLGWTITPRKGKVKD